jgi:hypothetical protein
MERATLGSVLIHCFAALAIPALAWTAADSTPVETVSFMHVLHVQIVRPLTPPPHPRAIAHHRKASPSLNFANTVARVKLPRHRQSSELTAAKNVPAAPAVGSVVQAGEADSRQSAAPAPTSTAAVRAVASVPARQDGGYLPFGAEQPTPVLDPAVRKQLDALDAHVTLVITVGDDGRTTNVVFQPPIDSQTESRIRSLLADANWDPAVCGGGVTCAAQATIKL